MCLVRKKECCSGCKRGHQPRAVQDVQQRNSLVALAWASGKTGEGYTSGTTPARAQTGSCTRLRRHHTAPRQLPPVPQHFLNFLPERQVHGSFGFVLAAALAVGFLLEPFTIGLKDLSLYICVHIRLLSVGVTWATASTAVELHRSGPTLPHAPRGRYHLE